MEEAEILLRNAMEHHGAAVYRLALCRMQSVQDAEDVYQDVFLRLLGQEASAWDGEHLRAWLLRCTVNRCHDLHRFRLRLAVGQKDGPGQHIMLGLAHQIRGQITGVRRIISNDQNFAGSGNHINSHHAVQQLFSRGHVDIARTDNFIHLRHALCPVSQCRYGLRPTHQKNAVHTGNCRCG